MTNKTFEIHHSFFDERQNSFTIKVYHTPHIGESHVGKEIYTVTSFNIGAMAVSKNYQETKYYFLHKEPPPREIFLLSCRAFGV